MSGNSSFLLRFSILHSLPSSLEDFKQALIHGSSDGRFSITYAVKDISKEEIEGVGFQAADYGKMAAVYNPDTLHIGWNTMPNGEQIYFIPNPALGLWINPEKFDAGHNYSKHQNT